MKTGHIRFIAIVFLTASLWACAAPVPQDLQPATNTPSDSLRLVREADFNWVEAPRFAGYSPKPGRVLRAGFTDASRTSFHTEEGIIAIADITWSEPTSYGGVHTANWRLFQGDQMLKEGSTDERLSSKPARIISHISAGSFPPGQYHLELLLDKKPFGTLPFTILASQTPAPLAAPITGPDCAGAPPTSVKPTSPIRPAYPAAVADSHIQGCASVSISLDNDGHPAGVRLDGEFPPAAGFGESVVHAAWAATFPPGHGGETTHLTVHFKVAN